LEERKKQRGSGEVISPRNRGETSNNSSSNIIVSPRGREEIAEKRRLLEEKKKQVLLSPRNTDDCEKNDTEKKDGNKNDSDSKNERKKDACSEFVPGKFKPAQCANCFLPSDSHQVLHQTLIDHSLTVIRHSLLHHETNNTSNKYL
jgi:hypothetical protein